MEKYKSALGECFIVGLYVCGSLSSTYHPPFTPTPCPLPLAPCHSILKAVTKPLFSHAFKFIVIIISVFFICTFLQFEACLKENQPDLTLKLLKYINKRQGPLRGQLISFILQAIKHKVEALVKKLCMRNDFIKFRSHELKDFQRIIFVGQP